MNAVKFYRCVHCGNFFDTVVDGGVTPICCGEPMVELIANSTDAAGEKHVPVIERNGDRVTVKVGSVAHPMVPEHFIQFVALAYKDGVQRVMLHPDQPAEAEFVVSADLPVTAYEYCNLHGLWKAEA